MNKQNKLNVTPEMAHWWQMEVQILLSIKQSVIAKMGLLTHSVTVYTLLDVLHKCFIVFNSPYFISFYGICSNTSMCELI